MQKKIMKKSLRRNKLAQACLPGEKMKNVPTAGRVEIVFDSFKFVHI